MVFCDNGLDLSKIGKKATLKFAGLQNVSGRVPQ
jgi:hypothetical protein